MNPKSDKQYQELIKTHEEYDRREENWRFLESAYEGGEAFIKKALKRNDRESHNNYKKRVQKGFCFNYNAIVIDMYSFYLTEKPPNRELGKRLREDKAWKAFFKDCDLYRTNFDIFLNEAARAAAISGAVGVLVDMPSAALSAAERKRYKIYPYCSLYTLSNILDWKFERHPITNRPTLVYVKLRDFDGRYLRWFSDRWESWQVDKKEKTAVLTGGGENRLGEVPFVWLQNIRDPQHPFLGVSDIKEIARIVAAITRTLSCGEEILEYAGFPMLRKPMRREDEQEDNSDTVGVRAVLEFNPEMGEAGKPDWLGSEVKDPVDAILAWIKRLIAEIYQLAHLAGIHAHEKSDQVRSGVALRYEFNQLGRVLSKKSENLTEAELSIIRLWLKWQGKNDVFDDVEIFRSKDFSVDDLTINLQNALLASDLVRVDTYRRALAHTIVKKTLPDADEQTIEKIFTEIENTRFWEDATASVNGIRTSVKAKGNTKANDIGEHVGPSAFEKSSAGKPAKGNYMSGRFREG